MKNPFISLFIFCCTLLAGQEPEYSGYSWSTFPPAKEIDTVKAVNGSVITLERRISEVYANKDNIFEEISIIHRKIRVTTHEAVNDFNKIYVPVSNVIEILDIRARFISPEGKITELPKESIHQVENLENKGDYKSFAIEGAETGGEIEYYYKLRKKYDPYGTQVIQGEQPRTNVQVIFVYPSKLEYQVKSYNGFPAFSSRTDTLTGKTWLQADAAVIPSLLSEKYAAYKANLMRYEFTLAYNNFNSLFRTYSFSKISANLYGNIYELSKSEKSAVKSVIKKLKLMGLDSRQKARKIEDWVKTEIAISEELTSMPDIVQMIKLKQTTKSGALRIMVALLNEAGLNFELVATCDKSERTFDPDFNGFNFLDDYLIYYPELNQFILPENPVYRLGINPSAYQGSFGIFLHPITYGGKLKTLAYEIKRLPVDSYEKNADTMIVNLSLNLSKLNLNASIYRVFYGEWAASIQSFWSYMNEERHQNMISEIFNMGNINTTINSYKITHESQSDIAVNPLQWNVDLTANSLVEQAGNDLIVKIGETIGEQSELYQETKRKLPIVVDAVHNYFRKLIFEIPTGYTISSISDLNMNVEMQNNGRLSCCFTSWYEVSGNKLVVYSCEYYTENDYPADRFEAFRKVINAAADFNKKTIILTKG
jgi:hypothetical protein